MLVDLNETMKSMVAGGMSKEVAFDYMMGAKEYKAPTLVDKAIDNVASARKRMAEHGLGSAERRLARAELRATQATE